MDDDLAYVLACLADASYDDPARLAAIAHRGADAELAAAATAVLLEVGDPTLHADDLVAIADVATADVALLADDWAAFARAHDLAEDDEVEPPLVHHALAALRLAGDERYRPLVTDFLAGSELEYYAAALALGDDASDWSLEQLRRAVADNGDDVATASLLNARALADGTTWARAAADLFVEDGWSRRQAASFLRLAAELVADSEDLSQYDDLVELAEDETLPRGLRRFALGYALSFDLEPEDEKQEKLQRAHVRRVVALSKAGLVPLVETDVPEWFRGKVDVAVLD